MAVMMIDEYAIESSTWRLLAGHVRHH